MTTSFSQFTNGDTSYVSRLNGNFASIASIIDGVNSILAGTIVAATNTSATSEALFGASVSVIGAASYACTGASTTLTVAAGYMWSPTLGKVLKQDTSSTLSFSGQSAGTYYISVDNSGLPVRNATLVADSIYSVVWTGSAFGTITLLAAIVWGAADDIAAQVSAALAATYTTLDARLEAGETQAVLGALARTWQTGRLSLSVAGSADVTLSAVQANNAVLNFTGALTGNISVIVPLGTNPREWIVTNNTSGAYTLTVKGSTGTGIAVTQGGFSNLYQDGTNVLSVAGSGAGAGTVTSVAASVPAFLSIAGSPITTSGTLAISYSGTALPIANGGTGGTSASAARAALGLGTAATLDSDTDTSLAANSDTRLATQKAVKAYIDSVVTGGAAGVMIFEGVIDCSANPNYPAANAGHVYKVSVAGKLGGASGVTVEVGDTAYCTAMAASGNQATVGTSWNIVQENVDGAVTGPASVTADHVATFNGTTGKIIKDSGLTLAGTNTGDETATTLGATTHAAATKSAMVDADEISLIDSAASFILKRATFTNLKAFLKTYFDTLYGAGSGNVTSVSVTTANGISGTVATATTTPAITLTLGAIVPTTVNGVTLSGASTPTLAVTGTTAVSGTNTGDQTSVSGNAGTATALQTARTIGGVSFDGTANITQPFDVMGFYPGVPTASAKVMRMPIGRAVTFAANFAGSYFAASANATGTTVFDVQKNGSSIGSISIAAGGTTATFTTTSGTAKTFSAGDVLSIIAPGSADATLADPGFCLAGTR